MGIQLSNTFFSCTLLSSSFCSTKMARLHPCHLLPPGEAVEMAELGKMANVVEMSKMGKDLGMVAVIGEMPVRKEEKTVSSSSSPTFPLPINIISPCHSPTSTSMSFPLADSPPPGPASSSLPRLQLLQVTPPSSPTSLRRLSTSVLPPSSPRPGSPVSPPASPLHRRHSFAPSSPPAFPFPKTRRSSLPSSFNTHHHS